MKWKPIETAPKDESPFLGYWTDEDGEPTVTETWWCDLDRDWRSFMSLYTSDILTHWMPLPPPPQD